MFHMLKKINVNYEIIFFGFKPFIIKNEIHEVKRKRNDRANIRYELEENEKREKNLKILRIHKARYEAGEGSDKI